MQNQLDITYKKSNRLTFNNPYATIYYLNVRSLRNKINDIRDYVQHDVTHYTILIFTETWLNENELQFFDIDNYDAYHSVRQSRGAGVSIYVRNNLNSTEIQGLNIEFEGNNFLGVFIQELNIRIIGVYRKPSSNVNNFLDKLDNILESFNHSYIIGDTNINVLNSNNATVRDFIRIIDSNGFQLLNSKSRDMATRISGNSASCIDHVLTDECHYHNSIQFQFFVDDVHLYDHRAIYLSIKIENRPVHSNVSPNSSFKITQHQKMIDDKILSNLNSTNLEKFIQDFTTHLNNYSKTVTFKNNFKKPFMNKQIYNFIIIRDNYFRLFKKYPHRLDLFAQYKTYRNKINKLILEAKKAVNSEALKKDIGDPRRTWKTINSIFYGKTPDKSTKIPAITVNNISLSDSTEICNAFNDYFINVPSTIINAINRDPTLYHNLSLSDQYHITTPFSYQPTTEDEISQIISNLNNSNSLDCYGLSSNMLKLHKNEISCLLSHLINTEIENGNFPDSLKISRVLPIFKSGSKAAMSNYRPISNPPVLAKVFDKAILNRLSIHLENNNVINEYQFGFQPDSNCETAVLHLLNEIYTNIEQKKITCSIFIDLSKAFDCINPNLLLENYNNLELPVNFMNVLKSYFQDRKQFVQLLEAQSSVDLVTNGVGQGTSSGPLHFLVYINGIFNLNLHGKLQMFADDCALTYGVKDLQTLKSHIEEDLVTLNIYFKSHYL
jgi:hypothetical protein